MKNSNLYKTHQRDAILEYLNSCKECVSADDIINALKAAGKPVSKATVYRTLELFCSEGTVSRFNGDTGDRAVYCSNSSQTDHFHIKCTLCGTTRCVDYSLIDNVENHFLNSLGFAVNHAQTTLYGTCKLCRSK